jgi:hypothetical protein
MKSMSKTSPPSHRVELSGDLMTPDTPHGFSAGGGETFISWLWHGLCSAVDPMATDLAKAGSRSGAEGLGDGVE